VTLSAIQSDCTSFRSSDNKRYVALSTNAALSFFEGLSYSHRKEYVDWISQAKRDETRSRRIKAAVERLAKGAQAK
jgi:uncharacterized protein YdeI (YjbR/CyaY-like superfamily)